MPDRTVSEALDKIEREAAQSRRKIDSHIVTMRLSGALSADAERQIQAAYVTFDRGVANCKRRRSGDADVRPRSRERPAAGEDRARTRRGQLVDMTEANWPARPPKQWYRSAIWQRRRAHFLRENPACVECLKTGKVVVARVADHEPPHANDWLAFRFGPLRALCLDCASHFAHWQQRRGFDKTIALDGWPVDERHPVYALQKK